MNEFYGAFANAALDNYISKADPRKLFGNTPTTQDDIESGASTTQSTNNSFASTITSSIGNVKEKLFNTS